MANYEKTGQPSMDKTTEVKVEEIGNAEELIKAEENWIYAEETEYNDCCKESVIPEKYSKPPESEILQKFKCEHCREKFELNDLKRHLEIHIKTEQFQCAQCGKIFNEEMDLEVHGRTHEEDRPYGCEHCGIKFDEKSDLEVHGTTHKGDNSYECEHCEKTLQNLMLKSKLNRLGLSPMEVGQDGDCFFKAVSHQLYNDPRFHVHIRAGGILYMNEHSERFIESVTDQNWSGYIRNMANPGTWGDGLIIQAVADKFYLRIHIIESSTHFAEFNVVEPDSSVGQAKAIYIGHVSEMHYVSTTTNKINNSSGKSATISNPSNIFKKKRRRNAYMTAYMRDYREKKKHDAVRRQDIANTSTVERDSISNLNYSSMIFEKKRRRNAYMTEYMTKYRKKKKQDAVRRQDIANTSVKSDSISSPPMIFEGNSLSNRVKCSRRKQNQCIEKCIEIKSTKIVDDSISNPSQSMILEKKLKRNAYMTAYMTNYRKKKKHDIERQKHC